ncbi:MAG: tyrosine-type recombinase/integrase, partial [Lactococcus raffinolactis]
LNITPLLSTKGARHTYGSVLLHRGIDMGVIAKLLGHKDISMLIEVYGHILRETLDAGNDKIKKIMGSFGKNIKEKALHQRAEPFFDAPCRA